MRSILEQAVIHHLNGDAEKAQELFHQFIVTRARQIHESMRNGEDPLVEGFDDINSEEYFNESELDELEDLEDDNVDGEFGDEAGLGGDEDLGGEEAAGEVGDELGLGGDEELGGDEDLGGEELGGDTDELEARVEDLEAELERLVAKFDEEQGDEGLGDDAEMAGDLEDDMAGDTAGDLGGDDLGGEEEEDDLPFEGLGEGDQAKLEPVAANPLKDATEIADGGKISQNNKSGLPQKNAAARQGGSPVHLKSSTHKGFEREAAPAVASMKARKNNVAKGDSNQSSVAAPANAEGTSQGGGKRPVNTKSPVVAAKGVQK